MTKKLDFCNNIIETLAELNLSFTSSPVSMSPNGFVSGLTLKIDLKNNFKSNFSKIKLKNRKIFEYQTNVQHLNFKLNHACCRLTLTYCSLI